MKSWNEVLGGSNRQLLLRLLARFHFGLAAAMLLALLFDVMNYYGILSLSLSSVFLRGFLLGLPAALSYYAVKRLRAMWQYLLASVALCGLGWLLTGHLGGLVLTALVCFFRGRVRLQEEEEGPIRSMFDSPSYPILALFAAAFVLSAILGRPVLQKLSLLGAVFYLLVVLAYKGVFRVDEYLVLNQTMHNLPARRIQRIAGAAVAACAMLAALLLLPPVLAFSGQARIYLPENLPTQEVQHQPAEERQPSSMDQAQALREAFGDGPSWQIPPIVTHIIFGVLGAAAVTGLAGAVWQLVKDFGHSYTDSRDFVQRLTKEDGDKGVFLRSHRQRLSVWDRTPNATVRRHYRQAVLKAKKEAPEAWRTPAQLEDWAGLRQPELHMLYEKARYGQEPCTAQEAKEAGRLG